MRKANKFFPLFFPAVAMVALILDSRTAVEGAAAGISMCLQTVVPSLFPMMVLSSILTSQLISRKIPLLKPLNRFCGIPRGAEGLFLTGVLGGYPLGAKCVTEAFQNGALTRQEAERMLSFCSNTGPAFLFGICGGLFLSPWTCWVLWLLHILCAIFTAALLPGKTDRTVVLKKTYQKDFVTTVFESVKTIAAVCGWIILFRVLIQFLQKWLLWLIPSPAAVLLSGFLELTNGCCMLGHITNDTIRFVLCSVMLSFGGLCVSMQTASVISDLKLSCYLRGKAIQTMLSFLLSAAISQALFSGDHKWMYLSVPVFGAIAIALIIFFKKTVAFRKNMIYNQGEVIKMR